MRFGTAQGSGSDPRRLVGEALFVGRAQPVAAACGAALLLALWLGPLVELARRLFTAHMVLHMGIVAVAAPLLALGVAGGRMDPARRWPALLAPVPAALVELVVVWGWHAPALHAAARSSVWPFALEQASFLGAGLLVWLAALGGDPGSAGERSGAGALGLLLTSMHMTLLGALLGLASRPLYAHAGQGAGGLSPLEDQHLGGAVMLGVGGAAYLAGGIFLVARLLRARVPTRSSIGEERSW